MKVFLLALGVFLGILIGMVLNSHDLMMHDEHKMLHDEHVALMKAISELKCDRK